MNKEPEIKHDLSFLEDDERIMLKELIGLTDGFYEDSDASTFRRIVRYRNRNSLISILTNSPVFFRGIIHIAAYSNSVRVYLDDTNDNRSYLIREYSFFKIC